MLLYHYIISPKFFNLNNQYQNISITCLIEIPGRLLPLLVVNTYGRIFSFKLFYGLLAIGLIALYMLLRLSYAYVLYITLCLGFIRLILGALWGLTFICG